VIGSQVPRAPGLADRRCAPFGGAAGTEWKRRPPGTDREVRRRAARAGPASTAITGFKRPADHTWPDGPCGRRRLALRPGRG
jgi:hypothetical protein